MDPLRYLFGVVDEELAVVHAREDFDVRLRTEGEEVLHLRFGDKSFFRAVPEMDVCAVNGVEAVGIDGLIAVHDCLRSAEGPDLLALVQQDIEIVRTEECFPEARPVVAGPDIRRLVVAQRIDEPSGQRQQRCGIEDGMVDGQFVALQDAREDLTAEREPVSAIQMSVKMRFYIGDDLCGLVVHRGETGVLAERETVHFGGDDTEAVFRQANERKEYLVRHSQAGNEQQSRGFIVAEELEVHITK